MQGFKFIDVKQHSREWESWRRRGLDKSDMAALMECSPFDNDTLSELIEEKVTGIPRKEETFAMRQGKSKEYDARRLFVDQTGHDDLRPVCLESLQHPWQRCSLDGFAFRLGGGHIIAEMHYARKPWHEMAIKGLIPPHYRWELNHICLVANVSRVFYVSYNDSRPFADHKMAVVRFNAQADELAALLEKEKAVSAEIERRIRERRKVAG